MAAVRRLPAHRTGRCHTPWRHGRAGCCAPPGRIRLRPARRLRPGPRHLADCLELYRQVGDRAGEARVHQSLGWVAERQGRYTDALDHNEQAVALYRAAEHRAGQASAFNNVGWCHALLGDHQRASARTASRPCPAPRSRQRLRRGTCLGQPRLRRTPTRPPGRSRSVLSARPRYHPGTGRSLWRGRHPHPPRRYLPRGEESARGAGSLAAGPEHPRGPAPAPPRRRSGSCQARRPASGRGPRSRRTHSVVRSPGCQLTGSMNC